MNINPMEIMQRVNQLKSQGGDPNQMIRQMLNSGRITQKDYDNAVKKANELMKILKQF